MKPVHEFTMTNKYGRKAQCEIYRGGVLSRYLGEAALDDEIKSIQTSEYSTLNEAVEALIGMVEKTDFPWYRDRRGNGYSQPHLQREEK